MSCVRRFYESRGIPKETASIIIASWRKSTAAQYEGYIKKWCTFCRERKVNSLCFDENLVLEFLTFLFNKGLGYSSINTARSALSAILWSDCGKTVGNFPTVKRFLKGVFELKPSLPRYQHTWDVNIVLDYLINLYPLEDCNLEELSHKLVMLLAIITAQRTQTLSQLNIENLFIDGNKCTFVVDGKLKTTKQYSKTPIINIPRFENKKLCVVYTLSEYLERTNNLRNGEKKLFISYCKPHRAISPDTISRWIKKVMYEAGIEIDIFKAHSTRSASVSAAFQLNTNIEEILKTAGWSNAKTFAKFYNKPITNGVEYGQRLFSLNQRN